LSGSGDDTPLVVVAEVRNRLQGQFLIDLLWQQGGVRAMMRDLPGALPAVYGGDGPYAILVRAEDRDRAQCVIVGTDATPGELPSPWRRRRRYRKHPPHGTPE
jgi:hypothetical protein